MKHIIYIIGIAVISVLMVSCGPRHKAISLAEDFIEANAKAPEKIKNREFGKLGTTNKLNDSLIIAMRARKNDLLKDGIEYPEAKIEKKLRFLRMNFTYDEDTLSQTFYFDEALEHMIAVK